jgi:hypothetical protein
MHKRFLVITILAVALLFSQVSNLLIASLCPHLRSGFISCEIQVSQPIVSHEHMGHEQMESMETESTSEQNTYGNALDQPTEPCKHCAVHSRSGADPSSLRETEAAKRSIYLELPLIISRVVSVSPSFVTILSARAHGPPGYQRPRHILINTFRI